MSDLFPSFFESRKPASLPAKVANRAKVFTPAPSTLAPLATLACSEAQIGTAAIVTAPSWQARAASLEAAGLPPDWAEPLARLLCGGPPSGFEPHRWASAVEGASIFAEQWAAQAFALGWSTQETLGLDDVAPGRRHDKKGLALLLPDGKRVIALDAAGADIETARGVRQRYYRRNETTLAKVGRLEAKVTI
jgi:hypothetical protein